MIPPINIGDQLFLESLVRHTEENILAQNQTRSSTQPLLTVRPRSNISSPYSEEPAPYELPAPPYQERDEFPIDEEQSSTPLRAANYLLFRTPHPPSSFNALHPTSVLQSRQPSQVRSSTLSSVYDGQAFESFDTGILRNCEPPLFYRPEHLSPTSPTQFSLPIPVRAQRQQAQNRRSSQRYSTQSVTSSIQQPPQTTAKSRNGSLTVSLRTEEGKEEWEFPTPPRNSGCWFSPLSNNETPRPSEDMDIEDEEDDGDDMDLLREINAEVEVASHTSSSLGASIASSSASALHTPVVMPHAHTFGLGAKSILSLNGRNTVENTTNVTYTSKRYGTLVNRCSLDEFYGDEELESVRSAFADVSLSSTGVDMCYDGAGDTLSDTDSFADPAFVRSSGLGLGFAPKPSFLL